MANPTGDSAGALSNINKVVHTLHTVDDITLWTRTLSNWLRTKHAIRIIQGSEVEPFRDPAVARPPGAIAGDSPPIGLEILGSVNPALTLTAAQHARWETWCNREWESRSAILQTVSASLATEIETLWSALDMMNHLNATFRIDTLERRIDLKRRLDLFALSGNPTKESMLAHLEGFTNLVAEAIRSGIVIEDWDKCERFISSLPQADMTELRIKWDNLPVIRQTWLELVSIYRLMADRRSHDALRQQAVINAAIFDPTKPKQGAKQNNRNSGKGQGKKGGKDKSKDKCNHCGNKGHWERDCNKKKNGEPSMKEFKEWKEKQGKGNKGNVNSSVGDATATASSAIFGDILAVTPYSRTDRDMFLLDSGASHHLVPYASKLMGTRPLDQPLTFRLAGSTMEIYAHHVGHLGLTLSDGGHSLIKNVYIVPQSRLCILSVGKLASDGWRLDWDKRELRRGRGALKVHVINDLPYVRIKGFDSSGTNFVSHLSASTEISPAPIESTNDKASPNAMLLEHRRFCHRNPSDILKLAERGLTHSTLEELKRCDFKMDDCDACNLQKATRVSKTGQSVRGTREGEFVHVDLAGPITASAAGNIYYLAIVTDYTKIGVAVPIKSKGAAWQIIEEFIALFEKQSGIPIKVLRSDGGLEFGDGPSGNASAKSFYSRKGILHQVSPRATPELNGVAERFNRTIKEMIKAMLHNTPLGSAHWDHAARYASIVSNLTQVNDDGVSAYKILTGREPNPERILEFGSIVSAVLPPANRSLDFGAPRAEVARFIGLPALTSGYIVRFETTGQIVNCLDVKAMNYPISLPLRTSIAPPAPVTRPIDPVPRTVVPAPPGIQVAPATAPIAPIAPPLPVVEIQEPVAPVGPPQSENEVPTEAVGQSTDRLASPSPSIHSQAPSAPAPVDTAPAPRRSARLNSVEDVTGFQDRYDSIQGFIAMVVGGEGFPRTLKEAVAREDKQEWIDCAKKEFDMLVKKGTFSEATLPADRKTVGCRWVLTIKYDADGRAVKYKARLVAQGFSQQPGVDFELTYAPVGRIASLRLVLHIAGACGLIALQFDVEGAYLNSNLDRPIYLRYPEGVHPSNDQYDCLLAHKAIYGLKQSGREWWLLLGDRLTSLGFVRIESDWGVYVKKDDKEKVTMIMVVYVDDMVCCGKSKEAIDELFDQLGQEWRITRLGEVTHILGMKAIRDWDLGTVTLHQGGYIDKLAAKFPTYPRNAGKYAPLPVDPIVANDLLPSITPYQEIVGSLQWLANCTRPDIAFAANYLGRYGSAPTQAHYDLALRVVSYLVHTRDLGLVLGGKGELKLEVFSDADWGGCLDTRRSTTGLVCRMGNAVVDYLSKRQATVSTSTMQAEYQAAATATQHILWLRTFLGELGSPISGPTTLHVDNESAISLAKNPVSHARSKHIEIKHHLLRERVASNEVAIQYINTADQLADILTKPLAGNRHTELASLLRLRSMM